MEILKGIVIGSVGGLVASVVICGISAALRLRDLRRDFPMFAHPPFWVDYWETFGPRRGSCCSACVRPCADYTWVTDRDGKSDKTVPCLVCGHSRACHQP